MLDLRARLPDIPHRPGVYLFKDAQGTPLYIGKARDLRQRLTTYAQEGLQDPRIRRMLARAEDLEYLVTRSEAEALLLEANLIKRYQPRYNIRLKDDKKYPYIKITVQEPYPRIFPTRDLRDDGSVLFGPYTNAQSMRKVIRLLRKLFPLRTCKYRLPARRPIPPCLDYHIGRCLGPCFQDSPELRQKYHQAVQGVLDFLSGNFQSLVERLEQEMQQAARDLRFEEAAVLRDQLRAIYQVMGKQHIVGTTPENKDLVSLAVEGHTAVALVMKVRSGKVVDPEPFVLEVPAEASLQELMDHFLALYYSSSALGMDAVVSDPAPSRPEPLEHMVARRGRRLTFRGVHPREQALMDLARENARRILEQELRWKQGRAWIPASVRELQEILGLPHPPVRILAFDVSHLFGRQPVGSSVEFRMGKPYKSGYRRYRIRRTRGIDDYAMMREIVERRMREELEGQEELPQLLLIDGGLGQVRAAREALEVLGIEEVRLLGLAKRLDELVTEEGQVIMLPGRSQALQLLQRIRDEAHRFALGYHRKLRAKSALASLLDTLPGVGPLRKQRLLKAFGTVSRLMAASPEEIAQVPGIGPRTAQRIYQTLHGE